MLSNKDEKAFAEITKELARTDPKFAQKIRIREPSEDYLLKVFLFTIPVLALAITTLFYGNQVLRYSSIPFIIFSFVFLVDAITRTKYDWSKLNFRRARNKSSRKKSSFMETLERRWDDRKHEQR